MVLYSCVPLSLFVLVCDCCLMCASFVCGLLCDGVGVCCCGCVLWFLVFVSVLVCFWCLNVLVCVVCDLSCGVVCSVVFACLMC